MAVREPKSCRHCGAWWRNIICTACMRWEAKYPVGTCATCRRLLPIQQDLCRACRITLYHHGPGAPPQLWFGGVLALGVGRASAALGYTPQGRPGRKRARQAARPEPRPISEHLAFPGQLERDWSRIDVDRHALPSLTTEAAALMECLEQYAREHTWDASTQQQDGRTLRVLVSWLGATVPIEERDIQALVRREGLGCARRAAGFLDAIGLLAPLPTPEISHHEAAVRRLVQGTPGVFRDDVERWVTVLRGEGRCEHGPLDWSTIRKYLGYAAPVLTTWAVGHASLREVTSGDVTEALQEVLGTTAGRRAGECARAG
jgi:hypothetical protein